MPNVMTTQEERVSLWQIIPDSVLLHVFSHLPTRILLRASQVCKVWHRVAMDEYLWKDLLYHTWHIDPHIPMAPGKVSWLQEFKRLYFHTPQVESEVLCDHKDQVLHISFSHNGKLFATCSKDGYVRVWTASYPSDLKFYADMREFTWKYTQFSQFNETDTLLLVSGIYSGAHSTSGEIAVFNLVNAFQLESRVLNKPYDIFGTWYNDSYILSGNLHWLGHLTSSSVLSLNKALNAETKSVEMQLYMFSNINASSIRTVMIAKCQDDESGNVSSAVNTTMTAAAPARNIVSDCALWLTANEGDPQDSLTLAPSSSSPFVSTSPVETSSPSVPASTASPSSSSSSSASAYSAGPPVAAQLSDMGMKGADTSQSECSQVKLKQKDSKAKMRQKVRVMPDVDHGAQLLKVDDSHDDSEETIEYNMDYRRAEESNLMDTADPAGIEVLDECEGLQKHGGAWSLSQPHPAQTEPSAAMSPPPCVTSNPSRQSDRSVGTLQAETRQSTSTSSGDGTTTQAQGSDACSSKLDTSAIAASTSTNDQHSDRQLSDERKYLGACTGEDINVNTNSTGNNNLNCFSLQPHFPTISPQSGHSASPMPTGEAASLLQPLPIQATGSAMAPQPQASTSVRCQDFTGTKDRYLIFTTGMKTYTPHQIGIKRIKSLEEAYNTDVKSQKVSAEADYAMGRDEFDTVDHLIELHGHIIGMCLSPDNRYLYVNSRPWPQGYEIDDPLYPPPIAQEIDIHVIDLATMHEVGTMLRAHKAYTSNDECFFIFLDVCQEYVASGAEDKHGYLWDRHYGVCLTKFPHTDVVNSVAFNPQDPEMLITASDDNSLKIWRSHNRELEVKGHLTKVTEPDEA